MIYKGAHTDMPWYAPWQSEEQLIWFAHYLGSAYKMYLQPQKLDISGYLWHKLFWMHLAYLPSYETAFHLKLREAKESTGLKFLVSCFIYWNMTTQVDIEKNTVQWDLYAYMLCRLP